MVALVAGCGPKIKYNKTFETEFTAAKQSIVVSGYENRGEVETDPAVTGYPVVEAQAEFAVRYMGLDSDGDPILQVLTPDLTRTDVVVEMPETDRVHVGAYGIREVTVIVINATDELLTYRLKRDK